MQYKYDRDYKPPIPVLELKIKHPISGEKEEVKCRFDTGASRTTIPKSILTKMGFSPKIHEPVRDYFGKVNDCPVYIANISIERYSFTQIKVLSTNDNVGLIGRDILNQWILLLDGKRQFFYTKKKMWNLGNLFWIT